MDRIEIKEVKRLVEFKIREYNQWATRGSESQLQKGIEYLVASELESKKIPLSSQEARVIINAYALGYSMAQRQAKLEIVNTPKCQEAIKKLRG